MWLTGDTVRTAGRPPAWSGRMLAGALMSRRRPREGVGEPLFGEDWWAADQRLFQDSVTRRPPARPAARRPASLRKQDRGRRQQMLPWFEEPPGAPVNHYGEMAQQHWARWLPGRYAAIEDPDSFFSDLGNRAEERIDGLAQDLAGDDPPGEGYLAKAGRLGEARHRAEQIVLTEMILLEPEPGASDEAEDSRRRRPPGAWICCPGTIPGPVTQFRPAGQDDLAPSGAAAGSAPTSPRWRRCAPSSAMPAGDAAGAGGAGPLVGLGRGAGGVRPGPGRACLGPRAARGLLSPAELAAAARNTLNAHYTDAAIVQPVWDAVRKLGFTGGRVLEPGCGSGNFIGFAPAGAQVTGVELDPVTAGIAAALYPQAQIRAESFADTGTRTAATTWRSATCRSGRWCCTTAATTRPGTRSTTTSSSSPCT